MAESIKQLAEQGHIVCPVSNQLPKPYYDEDGITIYHGDCREVIPSLTQQLIVITDPPYGQQWDTNYSRFSRGLDDKSPIENDDGVDLSLLFETNEQIIFGLNYLPINRAGSALVWDKRGRDGFSFLSDGETAWWSEGTGTYIFTLNGQTHRSKDGGLHPTQKPVLLMKWCIEMTKHVGTIIDPFMGSGSTLRAAKDLGRKAIGIEIEEKYCEIAAKRLAQKVLF